MPRRTLHIAVVTLLLLASTAAAVPTEPVKASAERTAIAALWQKIAALFDVDREAAPAPESRAKDGNSVIPEDANGRNSGLPIDAAGWLPDPTG